MDDTVMNRQQPYPQSHPYLSRAMSLKNPDSLLDICAKKVARHIPFVHIEERSFCEQFCQIQMQWQKICLKYNHLYTCEWRFWILLIFYKLLL